MRFTTLHTSIVPTQPLAYELMRNREDAEDFVRRWSRAVWAIRNDWTVNTPVAAYLCGAVTNRSTDACAARI